MPEAPPLILLQLMHMLHIEALSNETHSKKQVQSQQKQSKKILNCQKIVQ